MVFLTILPVIILVFMIGLGIFLGWYGIRDE